MKKRIFALSLAVLMLVSLFALSSCKKETAYSLITDATAKTEVLDSLDADISLDCSLSTMGVTMAIPAEISMLASGMQEENTKYALDFSANIPMAGVSLAGTAGVEDNWLYLSLMGTNMKMNLASLIESLNVQTPDEEVISKEESDEMLKEILAETEIVKNEDGTKSVAFALPADKIKEILKSAAGKFDAETAAMLEDVEYSDIAMNYTINEDGYFSEIEVSATLSVSVEDESLGASDMDVTLDMTIEFNDPGADVTVTMPEGYESFEEVAIEDLLG